MKVYKETVKFQGADHTIESWYDRTYRVWYAALITDAGVQVFEAMYAMTREDAIKYTKDEMSLCEKEANPA